MFEVGFLILLTFLSTINCEDNYEEKLLIKPLEDGMVMAHFEFITTWDKDIRDINFVKNHELFPMSIAKFLARHEIQELHFSLTKGVWKHSRWGYPVRDASPGAELWLWFQPFKRNPSSGWKEVVNLLSGQFCASFNLIDSTASVQPKFSFRPLGFADPSSIRNDSVFYAALPTETVCTENLTPWKKLLPCSAKSGLATLLNAVHVFNSNYFSLALDLRPVCKDSSCTSTVMEMKQSVTVVFNTPAMFEGKQSWSFYKLFGTSFKSICPFVSSAQVVVDISRNDSSNWYTLSPEPSLILETKSEGRRIAVYDLISISDSNKNSSQQLNIASQYKKDHIHSNIPSTPPLTVTRSVTGYGVSSGGIKCKIENKLNNPVQIMMMEIIPWYFRMYLHTLLIRSSSSNDEIDTNKNFDTNKNLDTSRKLEPSNLFYRPAKDRLQPHHLEYTLILPSSSVTEITVEFDRSHLRWNEYPPDANHGVYIPSGIITLELDTSLNMTVIPKNLEEDGKNLDGKNLIRIHSQCLLVSLPTPDFSMPYNVICLVSTVISLAFGPLHKLTTMVASECSETGSEENHSNMSLFQRIISKFKKGVKCEKKEEKEEEGKKEEEKEEEGKNEK